MTLSKADVITLIVIAAVLVVAIRIIVGFFRGR